MRKRREFWLQVLLEADEGSLVAHNVAVVRCAENGDGLAVVLHNVPFLLAFMTAHDVVSTCLIREDVQKRNNQKAHAKSNSPSDEQIKPVVTKKALRYVWAKCYTYTTLAWMSSCQGHGHGKIRLGAVYA